MKYGIFFPLLLTAFSTFAESSGGQAQPTFFISSVQGDGRFAEIPEKSKKWPLPDKAIYTIRACLHDRETNALLRGQKFEILKLETNELIPADDADSSGCITWQEKVPFNFLSKRSAYLQLDRKIVRPENLDDAQPLSFAVKPWAISASSRDQFKSIVFYNQPGGYLSDNALAFSTMKLRHIMTDGHVVHYLASTCASDPATGHRLARALFRINYLDDQGKEMSAQSSDQLRVQSDDEGCLRWEAQGDVDSQDVLLRHVKITLADSTEGSELDYVILPKEGNKFTFGFDTREISSEFLAELISKRSALIKNQRWNPEK
jgi:hypothetical protein